MTLIFIILYLEIGIGFAAKSRQNLMPAFEKACAKRNIKNQRVAKIASTIVAVGSAIVWPVAVGALLANSLGQISEAEE